MSIEENITEYSDSLNFVSDDNNIRSFICWSCKCRCPKILEWTKDILIYLCTCGEKTYYLSDYLKEIAIAKLPDQPEIMCWNKEHPQKRAVRECWDIICKNKNTNYLCNACWRCHDTFYDCHKTINNRGILDFTETQDPNNPINFQHLNEWFWGDVMNCPKKTSDFIECWMAKKLKTCSKREDTQATNHQIAFIKKNSKTQIFNMCTIGRILYEDYILPFEPNDEVEFIFDDKIQFKIPKQMFLDLKHKNARKIALNKWDGSKFYFYGLYPLDNSEEINGVVYDIATKTIVGINNNNQHHYFGQVIAYYHNNWIKFKGSIHEWINPKQNGDWFWRNGHLKYSWKRISSEQSFGNKYDVDGNIIYHGHFKDKLYEDDGVLFHDKTNKPKYIGVFTNGKWNGYCCHWEESGIIINQGWYIDDEKVDKERNKYQYCEYVEEQDNAIKFVKYSNQNLIKTFFWKQQMKEFKQIESEVNYRNGKEEGKQISYYESGKIKSEVNYRNGKEEGKQISYYESGNTESEVNYVNGEEEGKKIIYSETGKIIFEVNYKNGKEDGKKITYNESGQIQCEMNLKDGKQEGMRIKYYDSGKIKSEVNYKDGEKDGKRIKFYESGKIKSEVNYKDGEKDGMEISYSDLGKILSEVNYKNGKEDGKEKAYYESGAILSEVNYKNGKEEGKKRSYYESGQIESEINFKDGEKDGKKIRYSNSGKIKYEVNFKNGKEKGKEKSYYDSGQIEYEVNYKEGEKDGKEKTYFESGKIKSEVKYKNGEKDGKEKTYYENGKIKSEVCFENGEKDGKEKTYYENGKIKSEVFYKNGEKDGKEKTYYENGKIKSEVCYKEGIEEISNSDPGKSESDVNSNDWDKEDKCVAY